MADSKTVLDGGAIDAVAALARGAATIQHTVVDVEGGGKREFTDRPLYLVDVEPKQPQPLKFLGLAAFVDYLIAEKEAASALVYVESPTVVRAVSVLEGSDKHLRRTFAVAECQIANPIGFKFNESFAMDALHIALQTCFAPGQGEIDEIRAFCMRVKNTEEIGTHDDGISQTVTAKSGIAAVLETPVKNPWELAPYRTFADIPQPVSPFVLRFVQGQTPRAALFETGNALWRNDAVSALARWLRVKLGESWKVLG